MARLVTSMVVLVLLLMELVFVASILSRYLPALEHALRMVREVQELGSCSSSACLEKLGSNASVTILDSFIARSRAGDIIVLRVCSDRPAVARVYLGSSYAGSVVLPFDPSGSGKLCEKMALIIYISDDEPHALVTPLEPGRLSSLEGLVTRLVGGSGSSRVEVPVLVGLEVGSRRVEVKVSRVIRV